MPEDPVSAAIEDIEFPSADGSSTIHARIWRPAAVGAGARLKAIVQVVHGMSEHIHRYDEFARYLCGQGYVVCGDDHIGHGASTEPSSPRSSTPRPPTCSSATRWAASSSAAT